MPVELIADYACECGEGPLWHAGEKRLYWTDIETGRLFRFTPETNQHEQCYLGSRVGGFTVQTDGSLLLFRDRGNIAIWRDGVVERSLVDAIPAEAAGRFNDVIADPEGRVFCGTLMGNGTPGRLYRLDRDGTLTVMLDGIGCSNGMGFTPDLRQMYFIDSKAQTIYLFDYDRATGALRNQQTWKQTPKDWGFPDGMTVDAEGCLWIAFWDGSCARRFSPTGELLTQVDVPARKCSCPTFGGPDYTDLYLTTAGGNLKDKDGTLAGSLFRAANMTTPGRPEFLSAVGL